MKKNTICYDCKFAREPNGKFTCLLIDNIENPQKECDHYLPPVGRYDDITVVKDLIESVISHGLSTQQHDLNRVADIIARASLIELGDIANSNEEISGKNIGKMFYFIVSRVWNWEELIRFYNEHTNTDKNELREIKKQLAEAVIEITTLRNTVHEVTEQKIYEHSERVLAVSDLKAAKEEILALKAKLYDCGVGAA